MRRDKDPAVSKWIVSPVRYVVKDWIRHVKVGQAEVEMRWETVSSLLLTSDVEECGVRSKEDRVQVPGSHDTALSSELRGTHATGIINGTSLDSPSSRLHQEHQSSTYNVELKPLRQRRAFDK